MVNIRNSGDVASVTIDHVKVECVNGDITNQLDMEAIVNAANAELLVGGGVAGAIHRSAGPGLEDECRPLAPIQPGEAVITGGYDLPNGYVIHCLGPVYGVDEPADQLLASCYREALRHAEEREVESVAFPAISTGAFGYPMREAAGIAMQTIAKHCGHLKSLNRIRFVLRGRDAFNAHVRALEAAAS